MQAQCPPDKAWLDEFLHCTFPRLRDFSPQGLANVTLALAQLRTRPPPAWLYAVVKAAAAALPACELPDLLGLAQGLAAINAPPEGMQLPKVDEFLLELERATQAKREQAAARWQARAEAEAEAEAGQRRRRARSRSPTPAAEELGAAMAAPAMQLLAGAAHALRDGAALDGGGGARSMAMRARAVKQMAGRRPAAAKAPAGEAQSLEADAAAAGGSPGDALPLPPPPVAAHA